MEKCLGGSSGECGRPTVSLNLCSGHYQAQKAGKSIDYDIKEYVKHNAYEKCTVEGCEKPYRSSGFCEAHYSKHRRNKAKERI